MNRGWTPSVVPHRWRKKVSTLSHVLIKIPINKVLLYVIPEETVISILELSQMQKMENLFLLLIYHHGNLRVKKSSFVTKIKRLVPFRSILDFNLEFPFIWTQKAYPIDETWVYEFVSTCIFNLSIKHRYEWQYRSHTAKWWWSRIFFQRLCL